MDDSQQDHKTRDTTSLRLLGAFFCVLGGLLFFSTWWSLGNPRATIVSIISSVIIFGVGIGMQLGARRLSRNAPGGDQRSD